MSILTTMRKILAGTLAVVGVVACVALFAINKQTKSTFLNEDDEMEQIFMDYLAQFQKSYSSKDEYLMRAEQFKTSH